MKIFVSWCFWGRFIGCSKSWELQSTGGHRWWKAFLADRLQAWLILSHWMLSWIQIEENWSSHWKQQVQHCHHARKLHRTEICSNKVHTKDILMPAGNKLILKRHLIVSSKDQSFYPNVSPFVYRTWTLNIEKFRCSVSHRTTFSCVILQFLGCVIALDLHVCWRSRT